MICRVAIVSVIAGFLITGPVFAQSSATLFTRDLTVGSRGEEVKNLQILLKQLPDIYPSGIVSGYFGSLTKAAVRKFQSKYGLPPVGRVGPLTRPRLNQLVSRLVNPAEATAPPPPTPSVTTPSPVVEPVPTPSQPKPYFTYSWKATADLSGEVKLPTPVPRPIYVLDGKPTLTLQTSASVKLADLYKVVLADDEEKWDDFSASMLLEMVQRLPPTPFGWSDTNWRVILTNRSISNDVEVNGKTVRLAKAAFARSNLTLQPSVDGNADRVFYSNRLYRAILRIWYNDFSLLEEVIQKRYGYRLGAGEPADEFGQFSVDELQFIATVLEDLPSGYRNLPGLEKLVRRKLGLVNPWSPGAPAIAWVSLGYIEFMDLAFESSQAEYIQRLVAHEMTHFLWHKVLREDTKQKFAALSGWEEISKEKWIHGTTVNFVSDYAATHNPDEDFAETVSYYIYNPDLVRARAPDKYGFVKDVVDGYEYVTLVEKQFTFQVFNLEPDTTFPGKIIGVDVSVYRLESSDNRVVVDLQLSSKYGDGAERAYTRIFSPAKTFTDQYFFPVNGNKFLLRAEFEITRYAAKGYWVPDQITVMDQADNRRYEGQKQFGWLMFIDNPEEDLVAPVPDLNRIEHQLIKMNDEDVIRVEIPVQDDHEQGLGGYATINHYATGQQDYDYADYAPTTKRIVFLFPIRKYRASGDWTFREFATFDIAGNWQYYDLKEKAFSVSVVTSQPDYVKPVLDVSAIKIEAVPTRSAAPNGETDVTIRYRAKDDNSGLGVVSYTILKPSSQSLFDYHYHENFHTPYFIGDLAENKLYVIKLRLPPGSEPGIWALREIILKDKAGNVLTANFVEIGILRNFKVF